MLNKDSIEARVRNILDKITVFTGSAYAIAIEEDLFNFGLDSINVIQFMIALEEEFGFEFADEELTTDKLRNLKNIVFYVQNIL